MQVHIYKYAHLVSRSIHICIIGAALYHRNIALRALPPLTNYGGGGGGGGALVPIPLFPTLMTYYVYLDSKWCSPLHHIDVPSCS